MKPALIGVDLGTTNIKAVAFSLDGTQLAKVTTPTMTHYPRPSWAYYEPSEIWSAICAVLRQLMTDLPSDVAPVAVAFTSMAEAAVPLDAKGEPTYPMITWFDRRTVPQSEWWQAQVGNEATALITGLPVKPVFGILKLLWLRDNEPDAFRRTEKWLNMADYGAYRLCGTQATDYSLASRMLVLDLKHKKWSQALLDAIDLPMALLGELVPSGILIGHVNASAAAATGLPEGLPVCSGGHDHVCGAFALGITNPGDLFDSMGTAESVMIATAAPNLDLAVTRCRVGQGIHVVADRYYGMSGMSFSGGAVDWIRRVLLSPAFGPEASSLAFETLIDLARQAPAGSGGLFFLPHLRGANAPVNDVRALGAFVGISSQAESGHFARAVLEGVAYEFQRIFENLIGAFELTPKRSIATGGSTRNELLMQIKAHLYGQAITIPNVEEATCLGAAMLAGIGAGIYQNFADASQQVQYTTRLVKSEPKQHQFYRKRYETVYLGLYDALKEVNRVNRAILA